MTECVCPEIAGETYSRFIGVYFHECVYTTTEYWSFAIGLLSLAISVTSQFPQVYDNYKSKSGEALATFFLLQWLFGDLSNLIGCLLTRQLPTQVFIAAAYVCFDIAIISQTLYYKRRAAAARRTAALIREHDDAALATGTASSSFSSSASSSKKKKSKRGSGGGGKSLLAVAPLLMLTTTYLAATSSSSSSSWTPSLSSSSSSAVQSPSSTMPALSWSSIASSSASSSSLASSSSSTAASPFGGRVLLSHTPPQHLTRTHDHLAADADDKEHVVYCNAASSSRHPPPAWATAVGMVLGWCSSLLYLSSRPPQILLNRRRRSVEGLSWIMFAATMAANFTYGLSVLLNNHTWPFIVHSLPWLLGSLGTIAFDIFILGQFVAYRNNRPAAQYLFNSSSSDGYGDDDKRRANDETTSLL